MLQKKKKKKIKASDFDNPLINNMPMGLSVHLKVNIVIDNLENSGNNR